MIDEKKWDALEALWTKQMESTPEDLDLFFAVASGMKKKGGGAPALSWLRFLGGGRAGRRDRQLAVLLEIARMSPTDADIRKELDTALRTRFGAHPSLAAVLAHFPLQGAGDPMETAGKIARWLRFSPGEIYLMPGRGAGRIAELNPALDVIRVEFSDVKLPLSLVNAEKNLTLLAKEHLLRQKLEEPEATRALVERDPAEAVRRLLESFGRSMTLNEVKENMAGLVPEARWGSFWASARKHPQLVSSGSGKSAMVAWSASAGEAQESVHRAFEEAAPPQKIEIARKHARRSKDLARFFAESLAREARAAAARDEPALAWELSQARVRLQPDEPEPFPPAELLADRDLAMVIGKIHDYAAREKALEAARAARADWPAIFFRKGSSEKTTPVSSHISSPLSPNFPSAWERSRAASCARRARRRARSCGSRTASATRAGPRPATSSSRSSTRCARRSSRATARA